MHLFSTEMAACTAQFKQLQHPLALGGEPSSVLMEPIFEGSVVRTRH
jgi:hypothetical protein